ncbi:MAG: hypothetical protein GY788_16365 [bacterium]|nr:hypothetical protein [bacterium]
MSRTPILDGVKGTAGTIALLLGLVLVPSRIHEATGGNVVITTIVTAAILLTLGYSATKVYFATVAFRRFGAVNGDHIVVIESAERISIDHDYRARIKTHRRQLALEPPDPADHVDLLEVAQLKAELSSGNYESPDSRIVSISQPRPNQIAVSWEPLSPIDLYREYGHTTEWSPPTLYGPWFFQAFLIDKRFGLLSIEVQSARPFVCCVARVVPARVSLNERTLVRMLAGAVGEAPLTQPSLSSDARRISWDIAAPERGTQPVLFAAHDGGINELIQDCRSASIKGRLTAWRRESSLTALHSRKPYSTRSDAARRRS